MECWSALVPKPRQTPRTGRSLQPERRYLPGPPPARAGARSPLRPTQWGISRPRTPCAGSGLETGSCLTRLPLERRNAVSSAPLLAVKEVKGQPCELYNMALAVRLRRLLPVGRSAARGLRLPAGAAGSRGQRVAWPLAPSEVPSLSRLSRFPPPTTVLRRRLPSWGLGAPRRLRVCGELRNDLGAVHLEHSRCREGCRSSPFAQACFPRWKPGSEEEARPLLCEYLGDRGEKALDRREMLLPFGDGPIRWQHLRLSVCRTWESLRCRPENSCDSDFCAAAKSLQSCPTLSDPIGGSPPGSPSLGFSRREHWSGWPLPSPVHESEKWKWSCSVVSDS